MLAFTVAPMVCLMRHRQLGDLLDSVRPTLPAAAPPLSATRPTTYWRIVQHGLSSNKKALVLWHANERSAAYPAGACPSCFQLLLPKEDCYHLRALRNCATVSLFIS